MSLHNVEYYKNNFDSSFQIFANSLNGISRTYSLYKEHPNYEVYVNDYENNIKHLKNAQNKILYNKRLLQEDNFLINKKLSKLSNQYTKLQNENDKLNKEKEDLINSDSAASGVFHDKKQLVKVNFTSNLIIYILITAGIGLFFKKLVNPNNIDYAKNIFNNVGKHVNEGIKSQSKKVEDSIKQINK